MIAAHHVMQFSATDLIATVPKRIALYEAHNPALKILLPPKIMTGFSYLMVWHPRMNTDAAHMWLRRAIDEATRVLAK